jgi:hypothetical protein
MGMRQAPLPALQSAGGRQVKAIADEKVPQVTRKGLGTAERIIWSLAVRPTG